MPRPNKLTAQYITPLFHWGTPDAKYPCRRRLNSDASKSDREKLNRMLEEMFEEADM
ncbi:DinI-like family protein [Salmonella enterica]|uniref:DinI-like family protein n=1 Tax=Salmonella enterica TaxID=28901 RepID=UPI003D6E0BE1